MTGAVGTYCAHVCWGRSLTWTRAELGTAAGAAHQTGRVALGRQVPLRACSPAGHSSGSATCPERDACSRTRWPLCTVTAWNLSPHLHPTRHVFALHTEKKQTQFENPLTRSRILCFQNSLARFTRAVLS